MIVKPRRGTMVKSGKSEVSEVTDADLHRQ